MNKFKLCGVGALLIVCALSTQGYAQSSAVVGGSMTLEDCLEYAKQNSITLQQSKLDVDNSEASELAARGGFFPTVSGSVSQSLNSNPLSENSDPKTTYNGSYGVDLSMTLYNGGKIRNTFLQSSLATQMSNLEYEEFENSLEVAVTEVYVEILYAMEQIKVAENTIQLSLKNEERGAAYLELGSINSAEFAQLQSSTASSRYDLVVARAQLSNLYVALRQLLELTGGESIQIVEPNLNNQALAVGIPTVTDVYAEALESRPEIASSKLYVEYADYNTKIAKAGFLPTLSFSAGTGVSHNSASSYTFTDQLRENFSTSVGLNLSVPIFSQFKNRSNVRIAQNNASSAELSLTQAQKDLYLTIETLHNNAITAQAKYVMSEFLLEATEKSLELTTEQYNIGAKNIIELLTEQDNYNQTYQDYLTNKYQLVLNKALLNFYKTNVIKL